MTNYGRSPWIQQFPKPRVPAFPRYRGATASDVVIIGGGLTGCATAYAFAAAGVKVTLLEAAQIGQGSSGSASGWLNEDPGVGFADLEQAVGLRDAKRAYQSWRRASLDFASLLRRLDLKCFIDAHPAVAGSGVFTIPLAGAPSRTIQSDGLVLTGSESVQVAIATTANSLSLIPNNYKKVILAVTALTTAALAGVGIAAIAINGWGWLKTHGEAMVLTDNTTVVIGQQLDTVQNGWSARIDKKFWNDTLDCELLGVHYVEP
jgi:hypothetical protein